LDQQYAPVTHHCAKIDYAFKAIIFKWFLCLFTDNFALEVVYRFWDMIFVRKHKAMFLIAFAIVELLQDVILYASNVQQAHILVTEWTKEFKNVNRLFEIAFSGKFRPFELSYNKLRNEKENLNSTE